MTLMCLVKTYEGLIMCVNLGMPMEETYHFHISARVFLGLAEAGLFPGVTYYLSHWYPRGAFVSFLCFAIGWY